ncbi:MAG: aldehyde ferredoxin oxidoreductase family protein [Candidatus Lernaella stagnicola]|nr:aldehyde ferredoxin oxidoreductase family protein [Candidatus Lernaella stagnicola]
MKAFYGTFAWIDVRRRSVEVRQIAEEDLRRFLGGGGLAAKVFLDEGDDEAIVIANGLLTGYRVPTACKTSIVFRSPLTGIFGESSVGGKWGAQLKKTGIDGLVIRGRSEAPVYLFVSDGTVEIRDASPWWGMGTFEAYEGLRGELPDGAQIGLIGPAGENGVGFASMIFEGENARAAGRTGVGTKFGEKKIKAVVVAGGAAPQPHDDTGLREYARPFNAQLRERAAGLSKFGTSGAVARREVSGDLPIKNFALGNWEPAVEISGQAYAEHLHLRHHACFMCPIGCAKKIKITTGPHAGLETTQPEYETVAALGSNLLHSSREGIAVANRLCNDMGIDTMSTGVVLGFVFECVERGILSQERVGLTGAKPVWGDTEAICELIEMIAGRRGIGDVLAHGVRHAASVFGGGSERFAIHAKGLELPMHDPRALVSAGATYATGNRGASHNEAPAYYVEEGMKIEGFPTGVDPHTPAQKGAMTAKMQNLSAIFDALGLCKFMLAGGVSAREMARFTELVCGWDGDADRLLEIGDRIYALKRLYNQRFGIDGASDTLPPRILEEPRGTGGSANVLPDLRTMLADLYRARGWDEQGRVTRETADRLGLANYVPPGEGERP